MTEKVREHRQEEKETNTGQQGRNKEDARRARDQMGDRERKEENGGKYRSKGERIEGGENGNKTETKGAKK